VTPGPGAAGRKPNHLAGQTSPYLLQHLHNPVDWHPWSEPALARARSEDKPIFLSIGYAACHWCHVMERESFEDPRTAALLNEHFVPIKVDREERPDLDEIYMSAVQLMTGQGGWPLNVFLTPDLEPFLGGTYFPPQDRYGRIGFPEVLRRVRDAWVGRRAEVGRSAGELTERLRGIASGAAFRAAARDARGRVGRPEWARAVAELARRFDPSGGFGPAPKFPAEGALALLLHEHARGGERVPLEMARVTLDAMARGGIYDHVGGGFARYSVDGLWLVPHFEKMLYNQALLVPVYLDAWLLTRRPLYRRVAERTLDFVRRELTGAAGGLHSSLDADSEGEEGRFYVWTPEEVEAVLGPQDAELFCAVYGVTPQGNFEGRSIPNLIDASLEQRAAERGEAEEALVERLRPLEERLLAARGRRVRPATDDKVLTAWNGLAISAFARAHQTLGRREDLDSARRAADFVLRELSRDGRLLVSWRDGRAHLNGYLDDYAFLARGLLDLYEAAFDGRYLERSRDLARTMVARFEDPRDGGFFFTSDDHESLLTRTRSLHDGALPSGAGVATEVLLRLAVHLDDSALRRAAERTLESYLPVVDRMPSAHTALLLGAERLEDPPPEIAIVGAPEDPRTRDLLEVVRGIYGLRPAIQVAAAGPEAGTALLAGKQPLGDAPTAFVCRGSTCGPPVRDPAGLARQLA
jgi:uncharacterized protein YyaL (SSP411 family)